MYEIEKNVPMTGSAKSHNYPFGNMEIGDSFVVPDDKKQIHNVRSAAVMYSGRNTGGVFKIKTRKQGDHYRCWRIA